ncbi:MAG: hypothetical protein FWD71_04865 [Oscillospiraceae bacterium]|nr:hypothetical protein [Oscillospiraceae bacterium]
MLSEEENYTRKQKRKKIFIIAVLIVIGAFVVFGIVTFIMSAIKNHIDDQKRAALEKQQSYLFYEPDYNLNIFDDQDYMALDRNIHVNDSGAVTAITQDNHQDYPPEILFMQNVVNYIINGDYIDYNKIFTDDYLKTAGDNLREMFTMQELYNIELETIESAQPDNTTTTYAVQVTYSIRHNNGTFRNDLPEGASNSVVYELTQTTDPNTGDAVMKATNLLKYDQYISGLY